MAETVRACGVKKESGYLYYLGKDGNVWRSKMARAGKGGGNAEKVAKCQEIYRRSLLGRFNLILLPFTYK